MAAVALIEPESVGLGNEQEQVAFGDAFARVGELATEGDLTAAVRPLADFLFSELEIAVLEDAGYLEATGRYIPNLLNFFRGSDRARRDPRSGARVARIGHQAPSRHLRRHVADHLPDARMHEIPGAGHAAPLTHPEVLAEALTEFFAPAQKPA